jgi:Fic family protein
MTIEEQLSWSVESDSQTAKALATNTRELLALRASIERIQTDQSQQALQASIERIQTDQSHLMRTIGLAMSAGVATLDLISVSSFLKSDDFPPISAVLSPALLVLFHRLTCFDLPTRAVGQLRTNQVSIADREGQRATHIQPPPAEEVKERLTNLCHEWNANYAELRNPNSKLNAIASFHAKFLVVHPFLDGNGRVARAILMQQCLDLFGRADMTLMNKGADYYAALRDADAGDYAALAALIYPVVHG